MATTYTESKIKSIVNDYSNSKFDVKLIYYNSSDYKNTLTPNKPLNPVSGAIILVSITKQ